MRIAEVLILRVYRAPLARLAKNAFEALTTALAPDLRPVIHPAREMQARTFGLSPDLLSNERQVDRNPSPYDFHLQTLTLDGEVYTDGTNLFVVALEAQDRDNMMQRRRLGSSRREGDPRSNLSLYYVGPTVDCPRLADVEVAVNAAFGITLTPSPYQSSEFKRLRQEGRTPPQAPQADEIEAATILRDRNTRSLAIAIKSSGGLLVRDLAKQLPVEGRDQTDQIRRDLQSHRLIDSEIVVVCTKTQAQVTRVPSGEILHKMSAEGVKCACGRPIAEERVEEALTITDAGRLLIDGNRWLTLLLVAELQRVGVPLDHILIEQVVGGDEVDCLADISGELTFFELKDKDFNLGNAYSFGAKVGIIQPRHSVIFSTNKVGADAREHFERAKLARSPRFELGSGAPENEIRYMEGLERLRTDIEDLATSIYRADARSVLSRVLPLAAVASAPLLGALEKTAGKSEKKRVDIAKRGHSQSDGPAKDRQIQPEMANSQIAAK
jgi:hypothetical protein